MKCNNNVTMWINGYPRPFCPRSTDNCYIGLANTSENIGTTVPYLCGSIGDPGPPFFHYTGTQDAYMQFTTIREFDEGCENWSQ